MCLCVEGRGGEVERLEIKKPPTYNRVYIVWGFDVRSRHNQKYGITDHGLARPTLMFHVDVNQHDHTV